MSRIATVTTVLTMLIAPAAFAGPADLGAPDVSGTQHAQQTRYYRQQAQQTRYYLGSVLVTGNGRPTTAPATPAKFYLGSELVKRSPNGTIVAAAPTKTPTSVDLRSPDAKDVFVPAGHFQSPNAVPQSSDNDVDWGTIGIILAGLAACGALALVLRRHLLVDRRLGV